MGTVQHTPFTVLLSGIKISMVVEGDAVPQEFIPRLISLHANGTTLKPIVVY